MLGKLMKYEFKACGRTFFPLYVGILLFSAINGVNFKSESLEGFAIYPGSYGVQNILMLVLFALFVALFVITILLTIQRFKKNLLDNEGYLMFTLPVKSSNLILSKLLVALIYAIISVIVASLSFFIIGAISGVINIVEFFEAFAQLNLLDGYIEFVIYIILNLLISYIISVLTIYLSLSTGQLPQLSKHRVAAGVILFFVINLIINNMQNFVRHNLFGGLTVVNFANDFTVISLSMDLIISLVIALILFLLTNWMLNKKLNLE